MINSDQDRKDMRTPNENPEDITLERPVRTENYGERGSLWVVTYEGHDFYLGGSQMASFNPERYDASEVDLGLENYPPELTPVGMQDLAGESISQSEYVKRVWGEILQETGAWVGTDPETWASFMDGPLNEHMYEHSLEQLERHLVAESVEMDDKTVYLPTEYFAENLLESSGPPFKR